jgi:tRNA nucleotidyltransferase/poly(A) polymerase
VEKLNHINILKRLESAGFLAYKVGGCVRDEQLGIDVFDYDVVTNATPDQMMQVFSDRELNIVGKNFGVLLVDGIEVATFRSERYIVPDKPEVSFAKTFLEDSSRRDFTINAMAETLSGEIIDYHSGLDDLQKRLIRAVGIPLDRFTEDRSRLLRCLYLASKLKFDVEAETKETLTKYGHLILEVPVELVGKIVSKVLKANCLSRFVELLVETDTLQYVFSELSHTVGLSQNTKYHDSDVIGHIVRVIRAVEQKFPGNETMLLAALYHDVAKGMDGIRGVNNEGQPNDLGHEQAGEPIAKEAINSLQFGGELAKNVGFIVRFHGIRLAPGVGSRSIVKAVRKMAEYFSNKDDLTAAVDQLFNFMTCDAEGFEPSFGPTIIKDNLELVKAFHSVLEVTMFYRSELPVNGNDIKVYGIQGIQIGEVLDKFLEHNFRSREEAINYLNRHYTKV